MKLARLGFVLLVALAAETRAAPAPYFRPNRYADQSAFVLLKRDLAAQAMELSEFCLEDDFWVATVIDYREKPFRRWQYVIACSQAPTRTAAFDAVRRRFIVETSAETVEPD